MNSIAFWAFLAVRRTEREYGGRFAPPGAPLPGKKSLHYKVHIVNPTSRVLVDNMDFEVFLYLAGVATLLRHFLLLIALSNGEI